MEIENEQLVPLIDGQSRMIASQTRDATPCRETFPSPEMTKKWCFTQQYPSFHSNVTENWSEKSAPEKEVHFSWTELTERQSPTKYSFSPPQEGAYGDSFGVLFDANDTQVPPNLERKTGNSDFIHERGDKISFEKPFLDKESIIDFPNDPLEKINFDTAYSYAKSITNIAHKLKTYKNLS